MTSPSLTRYVSRGVTLIGDQSVPDGVTLAFTEREGGVSSGGYSSLNLGDACGDDPAAVAENRRRALAAIGAEGLEQRLVNPKQVHGDNVVVVRAGDDASVAAAQRSARSGADAVVVTARRVPVLLCFADCVPVIIVAPGGFAVAHSGWRGTMAKISAKAVRTLMDEVGCGPSELLAYVGPHIGGADYEVSEELAVRFSDAFGSHVLVSPRHLDLGAAVMDALAEAGVSREQVSCVDASTASATDRFFSYRASGGSCGRHGAIAAML